MRKTPKFIKQPEDGIDSFATVASPEKLPEYGYGRASTDKPLGEPPMVRKEFDEIVKQIKWCLDNYSGMYKKFYDIDE